MRLAMGLGGGVGDQRTSGGGRLPRRNRRRREAGGGAVAAREVSAWQLGVRAARIGLLERRLVMYI